MTREGDVLAGRYRLRAPLGGGGMAAVWLADDEELDRRVAVKLLAADADRQRFEREARAYAACAHPNIARVYDYGEAEGRPHIVLEYVPGGTLEDRLEDGEPLPDEETIRIAGELAAGMAHAHAHGLVHRDLKPANIMFDDEGRAKIADFGIAQLTGASTLTETGSILGTAAYLSPEQARGEPATPASDVYAFGVILFRMLTGRLPFESDNVVELLRKHATEPAPPVSELREDAPPHLEALIARSLEKDRRDRPRDGAALVEALSGREAEAEEVTGVLAAAPRRIPRRAVVAAVAATLLVLSTGGLVAALLATRSPADEPTPARADTANPRPTNSTANEPPPASSRPTTRSAPTSRPATTSIPPAFPPSTEEPTTIPTETTAPTTTESTTTTTTPG